MSVKIVNGKIADVHESVHTHFGRFILDKLEKNKSKINQIELAEGLTETNESVRLRSIRVAQEMNKRGLKIGDVVLICAANHNDIPLPVLACLYNGYSAMNLVTTFADMDYAHFIKLSFPKMIFCDPGIAPTFQRVCDELKQTPKIVVFGDSETIPSGCVNFGSFLHSTGTESSFKVAEFDTKETVAFLVCTSGTTGLSKCAALSHHSCVVAMVMQNTELDMLKTLDSDTDKNNQCILSFSSLYWISGIYNMIWAIDLGITKIHCKVPYTVEIFAKALKLYNIKIVVISPPMVAMALNSPLVNDMDFTKINYFFCGGSKMSEVTFSKLQKLMTNGVPMQAYGLSEAGGIITDDRVHRKESCGKMLPWIQWKLINPETLEEVTAPNVSGELCVKSETLFKGYLNNPKATEETMLADGFLKTGDVLYYDEDEFFYVVDRFKVMFKYCNYHIIPSEIERVILELPEVLHCCVVGVPHPIDGEHPTAVIQFNEGMSLPKEAIMKKIKDNLADSRQLRGGIIFLDPIPMTPSGKINRNLLRNLVLMLYNIKTRL